MSVPLKVLVTEAVTLDLAVNLSSRFNTPIAGARITLSLLGTSFGEDASDEVTERSRRVFGVSNADGQVYLPQPERQAPYPS